MENLQSSTPYIVFGVVIIVLLIILLPRSNSNLVNSFNRQVGANPLGTASSTTSSQQDGQTQYLPSNNYQFQSSIGTSINTAILVADPYQVGNPYEPNSGKYGRVYLSDNFSGRNVWNYDATNGTLLFGASNGYLSNQGNLNSFFPPPLGGHAPVNGFVIKGSGSLYQIIYTPGPTGNNCLSATYTGASIGDCQSPYAFFSPQ